MVILPPKIEAVLVKTNYVLSATTFSALLRSQRFLKAEHPDLGETVVKVLTQNQTYQKDEMLFELIENPKTDSLAIQERMA